MSYFKGEYTIIPQGNYEIIRQCGGCSKKSTFVNSGDFRVNANGKLVDVWLIYRCEKCKHTYNLTIMERVNPSRIDKTLYQRFLDNDKDLAYEMGLDKSILKRNSVETKPVKYNVHSIRRTIFSGDGEVTINNPYNIKVRTDKVICDMMGISRGQLKKLSEHIDYDNKYCDIETKVTYKGVQDGDTKTLGNRGTNSKAVI